MLAIRYHVLLEQPLLATALVGDPNSTVSYDYIPGSALRGLFAGRYLRQKTLRDGSGDADFHRLFVSGVVRYLHAYPLAADRTRSLPTPRSLAIVKSAHLRNEPLIYNQQSALMQPPDERLKPLGTPFCKPIPPALRFCQPERALAIHVQRDRSKGRAWLERDEAHNREIAHGTVFRYEALAAGQWFEGVILVDQPSASVDVEGGLLVDQPSDVVSVEALLQPQACWLGRSRSAAYGKAQLTHIETCDTWSEVSASAPSTPSQVWTLTLLSDTLLRDREGNFVDVLTDDLLSAYLGVPVTIVSEQTFSAPTIVGGFNRTWQMPVFQSTALAAGSVITFQLGGQTFDAARKQKLEHDGIGERRAEGFGRIAFNWLREPTYPTYRVQPSPTEIASTVVSSSAVPLLSEASPAAVTSLAQRMAQRVFDHQIDQAITSFVQAHVWPQVVEDDGVHNSRVGAMPTNSQLARLGGLVRQTLDSGDTARVQAEFRRFRETARRGFERASLHGKGNSLHAWITALLEHPNMVWDELGDIQPLMIAGHTPADDAQRSAKVALRLLAAVLAAPAQKRKNGAERQQQEEAHE